MFPLFYSNVAVTLVEDDSASDRLLFEWKEGEEEKQEWVHWDDVYNVDDFCQLNELGTAYVVTCGKTAVMEMRTRLVARYPTLQKIMGLD